MGVYRTLLGSLGTLEALEVFREFREFREIREISVFGIRQLKEKIAERKNLLGDLYCNIYH